MPHFLPIAPRCIFVSNQTATKSAPLVHPHSLAISRHFWRNHWWWSFWHIRHYQSNRRCDHNKSTECIQSHCLRLSGNDRLCKCRIFFLPHFVCRRKCQSLGRIGERYQCFLRVCIHNYKRRSTLLIFCNVHFAKVSIHLLYKTVKKWILITYHSQCSQSSNSWQRTCHTFHQSLLAYIRICHPEHIGVVSSLNQIKTQVHLKWKCKIVSSVKTNSFKTCWDSLYDIPVESQLHGSQGIRPWSSWFGEKKWLGLHLSQCCPSLCPSHSKHSPPLPVKE